MPDPTLALLADELAIRSLTASYTDAINRGDLSDIARVYDTDGVFTIMERPSVVGRDARARWQITEFQVIDDGERRFVAGRYEDELVRRDRGWQFARRTFTARYLGDVSLSSDVRPDAPPLFPLWPDD